jgi:outer membrane protein TolC
MGIVAKRTVRSFVLLAALSLIAVSGAIGADAPDGERRVFVPANDPELAKILETASFNNPNISGAIERVNQARADLKGARAEFGPTFTAGVGAQWNKDAAAIPVIDPVTGLPAGGVVPMGSRNVYSASISFIQTIYTGGTITANRRAAEFALSAAQADGERVYQNVLNSVRVSYYNCRRALAQLQVAAEALYLAREHLKRTEALYNAGLVPIGDVLRVKVSVSQADLDRIGAENALDLGWVALERLVGTTLPRGEILVPLAGDRTRELKPPQYSPPADAVGRALERRAEIRACELQRRRAEQMAIAASGQRLPNLVLSGQTSTTDDSFWPNGNDDWQVQLGLQWTLFDSGEIASRTERALASARELLHTIDDLNGQVRQEVVQAELSLRSALTRLEVAEDQIVTAEEDYRIALRRYDAQVGTNLDVLDSRAALIESRTALVNAVYDIAAAQCGMIFAVGEDVLGERMFK